MGNFVKYQNRQIARNNPRQLFSIFLVAVFFLAFFLITLQQIGTPPVYQLYLALGLLVALYPVIGIMARTMQLDEYQTAGHRVGRTFGGMAIATSIISGGAFITLSGEIFTNGLNGLLWMSALILGLAVATLIIAPAIAIDHSSTLPQFLAATTREEKSVRISTKLLRFTSLLLLAICSILLIIGQLGLAQMVSSSFFGISPEITIICGLLAVLFCLLLGGMRALTWARAALYIVIAIAFLVPIGWISLSHSGNPIPHFSYGLGAIDVLNAFQQELLNQGVTTTGTFGTISGITNSLNMSEVFIWLFCIAAGTAAMPHMLQHFATTNNASNARYSGNWAMIFLTVILCAAPAYAAYITLEVYNSMVGLPIRELPEQAPWLFALGLIGDQPLASICGVEATDFTTVLAACGGDLARPLVPADISIHSAMIVLASANIADLPPLVSTLIAVGAFAALFSTIDGLLLVTANSLAHDGYQGLLRRRAPPIAIMFMSRLILIVTTAAVGYLTLAYAPPVTIFITAAFALAAAGIFPALITKSLGINPRHTALLIGMIVGTASAMANVYFSIWGPDFIKGNGDEIAIMPVSQNAPADITVLFQSGCAGMLIGFITIIAINLILNQFSKRTINDKN
ncbi:MAG: hypothetical protein QM488_00110 [Rhizobiaceae bacterium]